MASLYDSHRDRFKTGDGILFSGTGTISDAIKIATDSEFSHIGMIVLETFQDQTANTISDRVMITESTTLANLPDAVTGELFKGVQFQYLSDRVYSYDGKIWWLPLRQAIPWPQRARMIEWIRRVHRARTRYDFRQALGAGVDFFDKLFEEQRDYSRLFCSEYYTRALQIAELVPAERNPSEQTPADCAGFPCLDWPPVLLKDWPPKETE